MKGFLCLLLILQINLVFPQFVDDLGQQIRQQVQESLQRTQNLGQIISKNVRQQLLNLPIPIPQNFGQSDNVGVSQNVGQRNQPWRNLGDDISQAVHDRLKPVYAMRIKNDMKNGVGGTTVVTYGSGKKLIVENRRRYTCNGNIERGRCYGSMQPFQIVSEQDYCYSSSYAVVNGHICLSSGALNVETYNDKFSCRSSNGDQTIILTNQEYQLLCGQASPMKANYEYYANPRNPYHIAIPNPNEYVTCLNNEPNVCNFESTPVGSGTIVSNQNSFSTSFSFNNK